MPTFDGPTTLKGFLPEYRTFIRENLTQEMLNFPAPSFYSKWYNLDVEGRKTFWVCVIEATSKLECSFDRTQMFKEPGQLSQVTGKQNVSEGLMQMSYGDPGTDDLFLYAQDKTAFLDDFSHFGTHQSISSSHPERTILNPYRNLLAAIRTFTRLAKQYGNTPPFKQVFGHYWSTIRDSKIDSTFNALMSHPTADDPTSEPGSSPVTVQPSDPILPTAYAYLDSTHEVPSEPLKLLVNYFDAHKDIIQNQNFISLCDYSQNSNKLRLYVIDMKTGAVERHAVAHGKNSDLDNDGFATIFSNVNGSEKSSLGFVRTGEIYNGTHPHSMKLDGLSSSNTNLRTRSIVCHPADYMKDGQSHNGRSWGCLAVDPEIETSLVNRLAHGSLILCWHPQFRNIV